MFCRALLLLNCSQCWANQREEHKPASDLQLSAPWAATLSTSSRPRRGASSQSARSRRREEERRTWSRDAGDSCGILGGCARVSGDAREFSEGQGGRTLMGMLRERLALIGAWSGFGLASVWVRNGSGRTLKATTTINQRSVCNNLKPNLSTWGSATALNPINLILAPLCGSSRVVAQLRARGARRRRGPSDSGSSWDGTKLQHTIGLILASVCFGETQSRPQPHEAFESSSPTNTTTAHHC